MTAFRQRRKRSTQLALLATVVAMIAAAGLIFVGVQTLADSTAGRRAEGRDELRPTQRLPYTPTALVGTVDETGRLTSMVVMAVEPDGTGGSMVEFSATADSTFGLNDVLSPLNAVLAVNGPEAFGAAAEVLVGISFDIVELVDQTRFTQMVTRLGDLPVELPIDLYDESSGETWLAGETSMPAAAAARAVTAVNTTIEDWLFEPGRQAIWRAVADRVGAGIGSAVPVASDDDLPRPSNLDELLDRLFAGQVSYRALGVRPVPEARVVEELPLELGTAFGVAAVDAVSTHDRPELLMVMGAVAPGRVGAPLAAPSFRIISGFEDNELEAIGLTDSDVLDSAISRLLFAKVNVVSVASLPGAGVPEHTTFIVKDESTIQGVRDQYNAPFGGNIEVKVAEVLIDSVDIELILGRDVLDSVLTEMAGSATDESE